MAQQQAKQEERKTNVIGAFKSAAEKKDTPAHPNSGAAGLARFKAAAAKVQKEVSTKKENINARDALGDRASKLVEMMDIGETKINRSEKKKPELGLNDDPTEMSLIDQMRAETRHQIGENFDIDLGQSTDPRTHFLSWDYMQYMQREGRPQDELHEDFNAWKDDFGMHVPGCKAYHCLRDTNKLSKYGLGTVLYFKYLKFMMYMFLFMAIFNIPAMYFFDQGSSYDQASKDALVATSWMNELFFLSIGSWGEASTICENKISYGEVIDLACDPGQTIIDVQAYFGEVTGYCNCPGVQKPETGDICANKFKYGPSNTELGESCCASSEMKSESGQMIPDLTKVNQGDTEHCRSSAVQYIAEGMCLSKRKCQLNVTMDWRYNWENENPCDETSKKKQHKYDCAVSFADFGNFSECSAGCHWGGDRWECSTDEHLELSVVAKCQSTNFIGLSKEDVGFYIASVDAVAMFIFWLCLLWLDKQQDLAAELSNGKLCTADDYTVLISHLPKEQDHELLDKKLREHFKTLLNALPQVNEDVDCEVVDINFAYTAVGKKLSVLKERGRVARKLDKISMQCNLFDYFHENLKDKKSEPGDDDYHPADDEDHEHAFTDKHREHLERLKLHWEMKMTKLQEALEEHIRKEETKRPVKAFVTFNTEEAYVRCRRAFPMLGAWGLARQSHEVRLLDYNDNMSFCFGAGYRLRVTPAVTPGDVKWENMGQSGVEKFIRRSLSNLVIFVFLICSSAGIYAAQATSEYYSELYPGCNYDYLNYRYDHYTNLTFFPGDDETLTAYDVALDYKWHHYNQTSGGLGLLDCMCDKIFFNEGYNYAWDYEFIAVKAGPGGEDVAGEPHTYCQEYFRGGSIAWGAKIGAVFLVTAVNLILESLSNFLGKIEARSTLSEDLRSKVLKLFGATFVNTALLLLIINGNLRNFRAEVYTTLETFFVFRGDESDFTADWYLYVGVPLMTTIFSKIFVNPITNFVEYVIILIKRLRDRGWKMHRHVTRQVTQDDLNRLYGGGFFRLDKRYAKQLTVTFACLMYSPAMPILHLFASVGFALYLYSDKLLFAKFYRIPPPYDDSLAKLVAQILPYGILLHLSFGLWMYSNRDIFVILDDYENWDDPAVTEVSSTADAVWFGFTRICNGINRGMLLVWTIVASHLLYRDFLSPIFKEACHEQKTTVEGSKKGCCRQSDEAHNDWEGNSPYLEAIPHDVLETRLHAQVTNEPPWTSCDLRSDSINCPLHYRRSNRKCSRCMPRSWRNERQREAQTPGHSQKRMIG